RSDRRCQPRRLGGSDRGDDQESGSKAHDRASYNRRARRNSLFASAPDRRIQPDPDSDVADRQLARRPPNTGKCRTSSPSLTPAITRPWPITQYGKPATHAIIQKNTNVSLRPSERSQVVIAFGS